MFMLFQIPLPPARASKLLECLELTKQEQKNILGAHNLIMQHPHTITLDVVIPCYRVNADILDGILALKPSSTCILKFIVIIDDPTSPSIGPLKDKYQLRSDVCILVNPSNLGASASRNRGLEESTADWVHFLDDDVLPQHDLLIKAEEAIRSHPLAAGFIGVTSLPPPSTTFAAAATLTGMLSIFDIADGKLDTDEDMPWGVTANLIVRRTIPGAVRFQMIYAKTGGGEDVHFCREMRSASLKSGGDGFYAAPQVRVLHPWWNNGKRSYRRFYNLSFSDGALIEQLPEHAYRDYVPNSAEWALICSLGAVTAAAFGLPVLAGYFLRIAFSVFIANILHCFYINWGSSYTSLALSNLPHGNSYRQAVVIAESSLISMVSEFGRLHGILRRKEFTSLGKRFDWFTGRFGTAYSAGDQRRSIEKFLLALFVFLISPI